MRVCRCGHAQPRATKDLDIFIEPGLDNAKAVFAALAAFGAPLTDLRPEDFTDPNIFFRMGTPPQRLEPSKAAVEVLVIDHAENHRRTED